AIDLYFKSIPPPEWAYLGYLKAIKPYCISEARSLDDQKVIWRKYYITYLSNLIIREKDEARKKYAICLIQQAWGVVPRIVSCGLFAVIQLGGGVVPSLKDFWNDVKIEKELINKEVCMDVEWNLINLDCSLYPSTSKATFDKKSQMDALEVLDVSRTQKAKEYANKVSSKIGLKRTQKQSMTPPNKHARFSDNESESNEITIEDDSFLDDNTERDLKNMTFDEFVKGFKNESNWKLKDGRRIIDVLTSNVARVVNIFSDESKKERTPYIKIWDFHQSSIYPHNFKTECTHGSETI
ncbi:3726_t:CDS:2, partial [Gigaspora rosea]